MKYSNKDENDSGRFQEEDLKEALETLRRGGIILYPTDTVWGIGCDATNEEAVKKIYELKQRSDSKSMLALVDSEARLERYVENIPEIAWQLIETSDEPITIIYDSPKGVAESLKAEDGSLGIRITKEKFSNELCKKLGKPIVSTSANRSGEPTPLNYDEISDYIKEGVDYVVDYRRSDKSKPNPSHIIKLSEGGVIKIIR